METLPTGSEVVTAPQMQPVTKLSQKDAVHTYVFEALGEYTLAEGKTVKDLVTKEVRKVVRTKLFDGIKSGGIKYTPNKTDAEIKKYCSGLINNWLGKDERFN